MIIIVYFVVVFIVGSYMMMMMMTMAIWHVSCQTIIIRQTFFCLPFFSATNIYLDKVKMSQAMFSIKPETFGSTTTIKPNDKWMKKQGTQSILYQIICLCTSRWYKSRWPFFWLWRKRNNNNNTNKLEN